MGAYTFVVKIEVDIWRHNAASFTKILIEEFEKQTLKPESIRQFESSNNIEIQFKINADSEFEAWVMLNNVVKSTIDPAIKKADTVGIKIVNLNPVQE